MAPPQIPLISLPMTFETFTPLKFNMVHLKFEVPGKGDSFWKPSFSGSMLNFGGVVDILSMWLVVEMAPCFPREMGFSDLSDWEETGSALTMSDDEDPWGSADLPEISWVLLEQQQQKKTWHFPGISRLVKYVPNFIHLTKISTWFPLLFLLMLPVSLSSFFIGSNSSKIQKSSQILPFRAGFSKGAHLQSTAEHLGSHMIQWDLLFGKVDRTTEKVSGKLSSKLTWQCGKSPFFQ